MAQITAQIGGSRWLRLADGALTGRSASRRCISVCGLAPSGAFQRRNLDLLLSLAASAERCHCSSAPLPAFPRPGACSRPFDPAAVRLGSLFALPVASPKSACSRGATRMIR